MKRILIIFPAAMHIGGIERALLGLLDALAETANVETDLFLYGHYGEFFAFKRIWKTARRRWINGIIMV